MHSLFSQHLTDQQAAIVTLASLFAIIGAVVLAITQPRGGKVVLGCLVIGIFATLIVTLGWVAITGQCAPWGCL